jgi:hypothetical protein
MMASAFSQLIDIATSVAWQLTLTLMHVLWLGTAIVVFAAIVDRRSSIALLLGTGPQWQSPSIIRGMLEPVTG